MILFQLPKMSAETNGFHAPAELLPEWFKNASLEKAARQQLGDDFKRIVAIVPMLGTKPGDNYASLTLRLSVDVELNGEF